MPCKIKGEYTAAFRRRPKPKVPAFMCRGLIYCPQCQPSPDKAKFSCVHLGDDNTGVMCADCGALFTGEAWKNEVPALAAMAHGVGVRKWSGTK